jgi:hypothetical protein
VPLLNHKGMSAKGVIVCHDDVLDTFFVMRRSFCGLENKNIKDEQDDDGLQLMYTYTPGER